MMTIKEVVEDVFLNYIRDYKNGMHVNDVALLIEDRNNDYKGYDLDLLLKKVTAFLNSSVVKIVRGKRSENKESMFKRIKNKNGTYKKGYYTLRKPQKTIAPPVIPSPEITEELPTLFDPTPEQPEVKIKTLYTGAAGEMAVCSELLFRGYNASLMSVDDGLDIVAVKDNKTYYVQVKTATAKEEYFVAHIKNKSFERYQSNDCYYIVVIRTKAKAKDLSINEFIIFTADDIMRLSREGHIKQSSKEMSCTFKFIEGKYTLDGVSIEHMRNSFDRIK